ncbi:MAG: PAS domain S-box protein [Spirochaetales bacterium]|nr:PAS domain S-box protein [Spirochaetales bacterium]
MNKFEQNEQRDASLINHEKQFKNLLNYIPDIVYKIDEQGTFRFINRSVMLLGYKPADLIGKHFTALVHPDDADRIERALLSIRSPQKKIIKDSFIPLNETASWMLKIDNLEVRLLPKRMSQKQVQHKFVETSIIYGEISACAYYTGMKGSTGSKLLSIVGTIRDVSNRKRSEEYLRKMFGVVDQSPISIIITDRNGIIEYINPEFIRVRGYSPQEVIGKKVSILKSNYHPAEFYNHIQEALVRDGEWSGEIYNKKKSGKLYWESVTISSVRDPNGEITNFIAIQEDITEKKQTQEQLKRLREKETLLREIHHRVKNNLQIISSLMNLQLHSIPDESTIKIFKQCESRIKAMALIHEKLYQSEDIEKIDFKEYLKSFIFHVIHSHRLDHTKVKIKLQVQHVFLNIDIAIPCGLIFNELITNAIKHAFSQKREGLIQISLHSEEENYILVVSDNGKGLPDDFRIKKENSLGLQLVEMLVKQLKGKMELSTGGKYTIFKIIFPKPV